MDGVSQCLPRSESTRSKHCEVYIVSLSSEGGVFFPYLELPNILWLNVMEYWPFVLRASTLLFAEKRAMSLLVRQPFSPVPDASNSSIRSGAGLD